MGFIKKNIPIVISLIAAFLIIFATSFITPKDNSIKEVYNVYLDGKLLGTVKSKVALENYIDNEQKELKEEFGVDKVYKPNGLDIEKCLTHDAKILTDSNGKKGSMIFSDCLVPDGNAQGAELNLSSILDTMGYDCISKADFVGREDEYHALIHEIGEDLINGEYTSDGTTHADIYTEKTLKIWVATRARDTANADAPGQWSQHLTFEETMDRIERFGLGAEGGSLRKTGSLSTNNSKMSEEEILNELLKTTQETNNE